MESEIQGSNVNSDDCSDNGFCRGVAQSDGADGYNENCRKDDR